MSGKERLNLEGQTDRPSYVIKYTIAIIGPIKGETNMDATTFTALSSIRPSPAIILEEKIMAY